MHPERRDVLTETHMENNMKCLGQNLTQQRLQLRAGNSFLGKEPLSLFNSRNK